jgi:hypothetical protein
MILPWKAFIMFYVFNICCCLSWNWLLFLFSTRWVKSGPIHDNQTQIASHLIWDLNHLTRLTCFYFHFDLICLGPPLDHQNRSIFHFKLGLIYKPFDCANNSLGKFSNNQINNKSPFNCSPNPHNHHGLDFFSFGSWVYSRHSWKHLHFPTPCPKLQARVGFDSKWTHSLTYWRHSSTSLTRAISWHLLSLG